MSLSGVTTTTVKNILLDAGAVYLNYGVPVTERLLGATSGGNKFKIIREFKDVEVDGVKGPVKGLKRIITEYATLEVNLKELSKENLLLALPGSAATLTDAKGVTGTTHNAIVSTGNIAAIDYMNNIAIVTTVSGSTEPCVIVIKNVLSDGELEMELKDKDEAIATLTLTSHYDPADLTKVPYEIRYPVIA